MILQYRATIAQLMLHNRFLLQLILRTEIFNGNTVLRLLTSV